jgi:hypothetical protein
VLSLSSIGGEKMSDLQKFYDFEETSPLDYKETFIDEWQDCYISD